VTRTRATGHVQDWGAELTANVACASVGIRQYVFASWCVAPSGRIGGVVARRSSSVLAATFFGVMSLLSKSRSAPDSAACWVNSSVPCYPP